MLSQLERCMVTREAFTSLEWKTKLNQHLSSNKNPDHLYISRVIKTKLNQHLSSEISDHLDVSRVWKSDHLYISRVVNSDHFYISRVMKSDHLNISRVMKSDQLYISWVMKSDHLNISQVMKLTIRVPFEWPYISWVKNIWSWGSYNGWVIVKFVELVPNKLLK